MANWKYLEVMIRISYRCLSAWLGLLIAAFPASLICEAQQLTEVVAPVARQSLVDVNSSHTGTVTVRKNSFDGSADVLVDKANHVTVVLVPTAAATSSEISLLDSTNQVFQTIRVYPVSMSQEAWDMETVGTAIDPASREYIAVTQGQVANNGIFNGQNRTTLRTLQISGYHLDLRPGASQGLYETLMPGGKVADDVKSVEIYAKEIVVGAPIYLPGATLKIYAETLSFQDGGAGTALLDVTPESMATVTDATKNGLPGQNGGEIYVYVSRLVQSTSDKTRIVANGAVGQKGGPPVTGPQGTVLPELGHEPQVGGIVRSWGQIDKVGAENLPANWGSDYGSSVGVVWFKRGNQSPPIEFGTEGVYPGDGKPGTAGGVPGVGGAGGTLHATIPAFVQMILPIGPSSPVPTMAVAQGGQSGPRQDDAQSGPPGSPNPAIGIWIENVTECHPHPFNPGFPQPGFPGQPGGPICVSHARYHFSVHRATTVAAVPSPPNPAPYGPPGHLATDIHGWLHPFAARAILNVAEDQYRIGAFQIAKNELTQLVSDATNPNSRTEDPTQYDIVVQRANSLLERLSLNLDYFGNPAGWVPALDFPTLLTNLKNELKTTVPTLMVTESIHRLAQAGLAKTASLKDARDSATNQIQAAQNKLEDIAKAIPDFQTRLNGIQQEQSALQSAIQKRDADLKQQAEDSTHSGFLSGALHVLGAAASVFPIGQPILAAAVSPALNLLSNVGESTPWDTISKLPNIAQGFSQANISATVQNYHKLLGDINNLDPSKPKKLFSDISSAASSIGQSMSQFQKIQDASRAPASEVDAILQKLKAEDASLNDWTDRVNSLNAEKQALQQKLDQTINQIGDLTSQIATQTQSLDALNTSLVDNQSLVDHPGIIAAKAMSQSLRSRLDYYLYLVIKAYEYYLAQPYKGDRRAAATADLLKDYLDKNNSDPQTAALAYESDFVNEVNEIGKDIIQSLINQGPGVQKEVTIVLNPDEIKSTNDMLSPNAKTPDIFLNLEDRGLFPLTDLEARIVKAEVIKCECISSGGQSASAHIEFEIRTNGEGIVRTTTQNLLFRESDGGNPWGASIDLTSNPATITAYKPPDDVGQVLASILNIPAPQSYLTAPPVYPGIYVRARFYTDNKSVTAHANAIQLRITYSSRPKAARSVRVVTAIQGDDRPFYAVSVPDSRGLQHGFGEFTRIFDDDRLVEIIASPNFSGKSFQGWYRKGVKVESSPHFVLPNTPDSYLLEAHYQ